MSSSQVGHSRISLFKRHRCSDIMIKDVHFRCLLREGKKTVKNNKRRTRWVCAVRIRCQLHSSLRGLADLDSNFTRLPGSIIDYICESSVRKHDFSLTLLDGNEQVAKTPTYFELVEGRRWFE